jgi:hypothetical protein
MNTNLFLPVLGGFVAGVFVGAGQWFALLVLVAALVAWRFLQLPPRDPPSSETQPNPPRPGPTPGRFF